MQSVVQGMKGVATPLFLAFLSLEWTMDHYFVCFVPPDPHFLMIIQVFDTGKGLF